MKNIADIDITKYKNYVYVPISGDLVLYTPAPRGTTYFEDFDLYSVENGTIIAFTEYNDNISNYDRICTDGVSEIRLHGRCYEDVVFENYAIKNKECNAFYTFMDSVDIDTAFINTHSAMGDQRCDFGKFGMKHLPLTDPIKNFYADIKDVSFENIMGANTVLSVTPEAVLAIIYFKNRPNIENWPIITGVSNTFTGLVKLVMEWAEISEEPWNNKEVGSLKAKSFMEKIDFDQNFIDLIKFNQKDMAIKKFLMNKPDARIIDENDLDSDILVKKMFREKLRFRTLNILDLVKNTNIPKNILTNEKITIEKNLYKYCLMNNIEIEDFEDLNNPKLIELMGNPIWIEYAKFRAIETEN